MNTSSPIEGSPAYLAAHATAAVIHRQDRAFISIKGASPAEMLKGILSGRIPAPLAEMGDGAFSGEAPYSTILTPKGKMVTDLRVLPDPSGGFLLELPTVGLEGALAHFKKYLHPRFAQVEHPTPTWEQLTLIGPKTREILEGVLEVEGALPEPDHLRRQSAPRYPGLWLVGNGDVGLPATDLILPSSAVSGLQSDLMEAGALSMDEDTFEVLRIEAGTPRFGADMTEDTIPIEAGIHNRAIDYQKGCYTGQEVIVRIRDRGQVNKSLRWIFLGDVPLPEKGVELFVPDGQKPIGWISSVCPSPKFGEVLALGMVKRTVSAGDEVRLAGPLGTVGRVAELG